MAVFAAYADKALAEEPGQSDGDSAWLTNSSFRIDVTPFQDSELFHLHPKHRRTTSSEYSESSNEEQSYKTRKKTKKRKSKHKKKTQEKVSKKSPVEQVALDDSNYSIDKKRVSEYKNIKTIARPAAPKYRIFQYIQLERRQKPRKFRRYYQVVIDEHPNASGGEAAKVTRADLELKSATDAIRDDNFKGFQQEEEMAKQTASFNRRLQENPHDISLWIDYVNFQDMVFNFEKSFRKGSIAKGHRVTAERKLSILDKALQQNAGCERLLRMRLNIAVGVYPADELQTQLQKLVARDSSNIILWQGYIEATQCSMSHCTTPAIIKLYVKCLHTLHTIRRTGQLDRAQLEESILRMLYQCGLFLKQAGLFEQLWTLLRLYLELNLSPSNENRFHFAVAPSDQQLEDLEDVVLKSQLPSHELWLRIEKLRETSHWLPVAGGECEDPQRLVFSDDVSELIHPITMPGNTFRLTVTTLTLLKIPLLPCRHTTMKQFGIDYVPWALDSIETLLPIFLPPYHVDVSNKLLLTFTQKLAVGPQYLKTLSGQEEYLQFVLTVMRTCIDCLDNEEKTAMSLWWFRFQRLLIVLEEQELFKVTSTFKKKLRQDMKAMLKDNTSNVELFKEYALFEFDSGNKDNARSVLKTAISMRCQKQFWVLTEPEQYAVISALKTFVELSLFASEVASNVQERNNCLKVICAVINGDAKDIQTLSRVITKATISDVKEKMAVLIGRFVDESGKDGLSIEQNGVQHFLPDYVTDAMILFAMLLYLDDSIATCRIFIENSLRNLDATQLWRREILQEFLIAILAKHCLSVPGSGLFSTLDQHLHAGIDEFPNNLFILATLAKIQCLHSNYGQPWWKIQSLLLKSGHALCTLFAVLIVNQRACDIENNCHDTITGDIITMNATFKNRMLNLFKHITRTEMCTRRCGLVWRLYLQFLHAYFQPKACRDAYYLAVEECPWLKSLYIDAAIYVPEDLAQIQDLIIEKQLRLHLTPEELEVLRS